MTTTGWIAQAHSLIHQAVLAPSSHNTQPWSLGCRRGLQASYLNQPIQVASIRPRLQDLVGPGFPQILLRIGFPMEVVSATPRRPIKDVIELGG